MRLFECAWDGDKEGVKCVLDSAVQVDFQRPVRKALGAYNNYYNEQVHSISGCLILMYVPHALQFHCL